MKVLDPSLVPLLGNSRAALVGCPGLHSPWINFPEIEIKTLFFIYLQPLFAMLVANLKTKDKNITGFLIFRSGLTFVCGIMVYVIMWFMLHLEGSDSDSLGPEDAPAFEVQLLNIITRSHGP